MKRVIKEVDRVQSWASFNDIVEFETPHPDLWDVTGQYVRLLVWKYTDKSFSSSFAFTMAPRTKRQKHMNRMCESSLASRGFESHSTSSQCPPSDNAISDTDSDCEMFPVVHDSDSSIDGEQRASDDDDDDAAAKIVWNECAMTKFRAPYIGNSRTTKYRRKIANDAAAQGLIYVLCPKLIIIHRNSKNILVFCELCTAGDTKTYTARNIPTSIDPFGRCAQIKSLFGHSIELIVVV